MYQKLCELSDKLEWRGVAVLENEARTLATQTPPELAWEIYSILGSCFQELSEYAKAIELHLEAKKVAGNFKGEARAKVAEGCIKLGSCYERIGQFFKAIELHQEARKVAKELGNRATAESACCNLGICYSMMGWTKKAIEVLQESKKIAEEMGDRALLSGADLNLGNCYMKTHQYGKAIALYEQTKTMSEELGERAQVGLVSGNLGVCYQEMGEYGKAMGLHKTHKKIAEEVGDRAGVGRACGNIGVCFQSMGEYGKAIALHQEDKKMAEEVGDRLGTGRACRKLGKCYAEDGKFVQAVAYCKQYYEISRGLQIWPQMLLAAHNMGAVLCRAVRSDLRENSAEAEPGQVPGPLGPSSLPKGMNDRVQEAKRWLRIALDGGFPQAHLQLAYLAFDTGQEEEALAQLKLYLSWCVERGRGNCRGCGQTRDEDSQMLTCGGK
jgi:tetratricopeptide (TPR) repeat protein